ncbi:hypothetical protein C3L33_15089, partial [Rhododendron williamsianum]
MQDQGIVPDNVIYLIIINGMCKAGKIEDARKVFSTFLARGLKPNVKIYNTMISGLCKEALLDEAEDLLLQMDKDGCPPNEVTFNIVVRAFLKRGDTDKVKILLQEIINRNFKPDVSTMSIVVDLLTVDGEDSNFLQMIKSLVPREDSRKVSARHVNKSDAEPGGGVRQRVSSSEAEGNDGILCIPDSINVLDFCHPSGVGLKILKLGVNATSVFSRGDSIFIDCNNTRSLGMKQPRPQVQEFSLRKQMLFGTYSLPEFNVHSNYTALTQVWGNSNHVMGVGGLGLFVFYASNYDGL